MVGNPSSIERVLLYDAGCGFCRRWRDWARRHGAESAISFRDCASERELRAHARISDANCSDAAFLIELIDRRVHAVHRAAGAINAVLMRLPGTRNFHWRVLGWLYRVPGLRQLEDLGYNIIARNRHRFGATACRHQT
jgi:predicted DCC family thiol-disulfide oxidoreductase YuxK